MAGCFALPLFAQPLAFRKYDHRDGLPGSQVLGLLEDRQGFLWAANNSALARLGPHGFQVYQEAGDATPRGIFVLMEDRQQGIWAVTPESGLLEIRGSRLRQFGPAQGLPPLEIYALAQPPAEDILVATQRGVYRKRADRFEALPLPEPWAGAPVYALAADAHGRLWLGGPDGALACWDGRSLVRIPLPTPFAKDWIGQILSHPIHGTWVMTRSGICRITPQDGCEALPLPGIGPILPRSIYLATDGELLVALGTQGVLSRKVDGTLHRLSARDGVPSTGVFTALRDRRGTLWIGTDGDGLISQSNLGLRSLDSDLETRASLGLGIVSAIREEAPGRLLLGTTHGLFRWDRDRGVTRRWSLPEGLPAKDVYSMSDGPAGSVILATARGVALLKGDRITPFAPQLKQALTYAMMAWRNRLWAATDMGLAELTLEGTLVKFHHLPKEAGADGVSCLKVRGDHILLGTRHGVHSFDPRTERLQAIAPDAPFAHRTVFTLQLDHEGRLMVGVDDGLYVEPQGSKEWRHLKADRELLGGGINWSTSLPDGSLAVGHSRGVSLLGRDGIVHLTRNSGLISDETNQESFLVDRSGVLWFGMVGGLCSLDPKVMKQQLVRVPPVVREATWGKRHALYPDRISLPASADTLTLAFDMPHPGCSVPPRYEVHVDGIDAGWLPIARGTLSHPLAGLRGGHYQFRVRASLDGLHWLEAPPVRIDVAFAWHEYWTVRVLGLAILLGCAAVVLRMRTRALERSNSALEAKVRTRTEDLALRNHSLERLHSQLKKNLESRIRLMNTVTHDLRSPLTSILLSVDRLRGGLSERALSVIDREATRLETILASMLDKSRHEAFLENLSPRVCHPSEIVTGLADTLALRAETLGLTADLHLDPEAECAWILADIPSIQQVLFNLLENALKFTSAPGTVGLLTRVEAATFVFEVWDTGRGIAPEHLARIFMPFTQAEAEDRETGWGLGLSICKELVEAHQGRIDVESRLGHGARFKVTLPLLNPEQHQGPAVS